MDKVVNALVQGGANGFETRLCDFEYPFILTRSLFIVSHHVVGFRDLTFNRCVFENWFRSLFQTQ